MKIDKFCRPVLKIIDIDVSHDTPTNIPFNITHEFFVMIEEVVPSNNIPEQFNFTIFFERYILFLEDEVAIPPPHEPI